MRSIILVMLCSICFAANANELKSGGDVKLGLNIAHLAHNAGESHIDSLHTALYLNADYIFTNGILIGADVLLGGSVGNINKHFPLQGTENLTSQPPVGNENILADGSYRVGYALKRRSIDVPLYMAIGYKTTNFVAGSGNIPSVGEIQAAYLPFELGGNIRVSPRLAFEYLLAYDVGLSQKILVVYDDGKNSTKLSAKKGYGLRLSLGSRYYVSQEVYFYANILASYQLFGESQSASISISTPPNGATITPGYIPGSSVVSYPRSYISYVGLRFGIGF